MASICTPTTRVRISTGLRCNVRCLFCYYNDELNTQNYTTAEVQRMLDIAWDYGIRQIDFSGGEPSLRTDFIDLLSYAGHKGFSSICMISNGVRSSDLKTLQRFKDAGLTEVLLSVHGADATTHDGLTQSADSFSWIQSSLANCRQLGLRLRTNTVVTTRNYHQLEAIAKLIIPFEPVASNFICFNDWVNASAMTRELAVRYSEVMSELRRAVELTSQRISKVTVRYIPFCFLPGLERHVCGLLQNLFDHDEWIDSVKRLVTDLDTPRKAAFQDRLNSAWNEQRKLLESELSTAELALLKGSGDRPFDNFGPVLALAAHKIDNFLVRRNYIKSPGCAHCAYNSICDGLEPTYANVHGTAELQPVAGATITDSMHFRAAYTALWK